MIIGEGHFVIAHNISKAKIIPGTKEQYKYLGSYKTTAVTNSHPKGQDLSTGKTKSIPIYFARKYYQRKYVSRANISTHLPTADTSSSPVSVVNAPTERKLRDDFKGKTCQLVEVRKKSSLKISDI